MFYTFHQNNTGGSWAGPAHYVIIEADSAREANDIAVDHGLYFNGCALGHDCSCCGDRWYEVDEHDADKTPLIYGDHPDEATEWCTKYNSNSKVKPYIIIWK